jgi:hypothetical protein
MEPRNIYEPADVQFTRISVEIDRLDKSIENGKDVWNHYSLTYGDYKAWKICNAYLYESRKLSDPITRRFMEELSNAMYAANVFKEARR